MNYRACARVALLLAALLFGAPAVAANDDWIAEQSALCSAAIRVAEQRHGLPSGLLELIARAEKRPAGHQQPMPSG